MNNPAKHPDTETLDRLRAGLLDDRPAEKRRLEAHLRSCPRCARLADWRALADTVIEPREGEEIGAALDRLRRHAAGGRQRRGRRLLPLALAASLVAAIAVGLFQQTEQPGSDQQAAKLARSQEPATPDLYEDLDFYLWLADHRQQQNGQTPQGDQHG